MSSEINVKKAYLEVALRVSESIAKDIGNERSSKFGYDMLNGIKEGNPIARLNAWIEWYNNQMSSSDNGDTEEERNGIWAPAIPYGAPEEMKYDLH
jgi:hypothetical protein